ncbi:MAG: tRNA-2-methylthio-N(6)-dimethylallyladenosine synthase [Candidatus Anoxychlamydiales bacterium]|nr:tRNA-2-methylthio-N(6)-dimethylallyladenosine synthase [Candidatus Anoxychlamydiales bacterium]NGX40261.1 tRNA-2-methylthio-N(6)-dimethylallyladenosine synthase [Candidatus Anoxychlamydiales bacterium]
MKTLNTFYIRTYGCQMNELDSEIISTQLQMSNLKKVDDEVSADIIILNTCSIRDLSEKKVLGKLFEYKKDKKDKIIGVCGCMAMSQKETLLKKFPHLDFLLGTNNLLDINKILDDILTKNLQEKKIDLNYEIGLENFFAKRENKIKTSISIIRGCNNFCSYCIVPQTRGREVSRDPSSIVKEAKYLAREGIKEITLLGQNVNSYGLDKPEKKVLFPDLLYMLDKVDGIERIRFMTSHPKDITKDLMLAIRDLKKVCEFVHFPMQSGSNKILKAMRRTYTKEHYLEKVNLLKSIVPNATIGTDIIVGFPNETDEDFLETYKLFDEIKFDTAFIFAYSPRQNTLASRYEDNISNTLKQQRLQKLLKLYHKILETKYTKLIGTKKEVLAEKLSKDGKSLKGRTKTFEKVLFPAESKLIGSLQTVDIESFSHQTLKGSIPS